MVGVQVVRISPVAKVIFVSVEKETQNISLTLIPSATPP